MSTPFQALLAALLLVKCWLMHAIVLDKKMAALPLSS
jgi:hypothetical protein